MNDSVLVPREISWLSFNARVLQEANDPSVSLKERIRFLGIYCNNRDEFFAVRVAALRTMVQGKVKSYYGQNPKEILDKVQRYVIKQQNDFEKIWKKNLAELKTQNVFLIDERHLNSKQKSYVRDFFDQEVSSSIIPVFIDNKRHLFLPGDKGIFLGIVLSKKKEPFDQKFAIIEVPIKNHNRFIALPSDPDQQCFMLLEDLIRFNLSNIFSYFGYNHFESYTFKITKDACLDMDNRLPFAEKLEKALKKRRKAKTIRFLYDKEMNKNLLEMLIDKLDISQNDCIIPGGRIRNFCDFMKFPAVFSQTPSFPLPFKHPVLAKSKRVSSVVLKQDVLLHLPYHSFNSLIHLLREAAMDPNVLSIKLTAYRLAQDSKICSALINAVRNGKKVHIFIELCARFDEVANLDWKTKLEDEGVKVYYGIPGVKVHAKIGVVTKKVGNKTINYGFIGTGNLNEKTALCYVDHFLLTHDREIMADLLRIFKALENPNRHWLELGLCKSLIVSPLKMRSTIVEMIDQEIRNSKAGKKAKIILCLNSFSDEKLIKKMYEAADAGVEINMIVRSVFCGVPDQKKIKAISIVDVYLEHSRIWYFHDGGNEKMFLASADWMERNLDRRIEVAVPIHDKGIKEELKKVLHYKLAGNVKVRLLDGETSNLYISSPAKKAIRPQIAIHQYLQKKKG